MTVAELIERLVKLPLSALVKTDYRIYDEGEDRPTEVGTFVIVTVGNKVLDKIEI